MKSRALRVGLRWLLAVAMIGAGIGHFAMTDRFAMIVPPWLPWPRALVYVSGVAELAGGVGLLIPKLRRAAAWGLVLLYLAVFPANIHMAVHKIEPWGGHLSDFAQWARLPFQAVLIYWAWSYTRRHKRQPPPEPSQSR